MDDWIVIDARRYVVIATCFLIAILAVIFFVLQRDQAGKIAPSVAALAGVAAVGVGIWTALRQPPKSGSTQVRNSGPATSGLDGRAISGASTRNSPSGDITVDGSGPADAAAGGTAVSGVERIDDPRPGSPA
ncbi:hypothetical protein [Nocardia sp. NPDC050435]|uniref:hypothetical protein n=1 Tax=Nocardia sp. NPDC050435 TaxID=3155040 RepID=UPI0033F34928